MSEFSSALNLTWQIAASEAAHAKHRFIEKEHIFIALCKVTDALSPDFLNQPIDGINIPKLKSELVELVGLFSELKIDRKKLRRRLREIQGKGSYEHAEKVIHRSEDCKRYFERAADLAGQNKAPEINVFHILIEIMVEPGKSISDALSHFGHKKEGIKYVAEKLGRELVEPAPAGGGRQEPNDVRLTKTPFLDKYGRDLIKLAKEGSLGTVLERRDETLEVIRTLVKKTKNNPVLIGEAGVGKTAVVEGLAFRIARGNLTPLLRNKKIIALDMGLVVAGTKWRGDFEERMTGVIAEASANKDIILFIDEIHTLMGAGRAEGVVMDAADIMKPALGRGDITCIGATTIDEYRKYIEKDPALERRFQPIMIKEPSIEETINILARLYESRKDVYIEPSAIRAAVDLSVQYVPHRRLPDKAIDIMEKACTKVLVPILSVYDDKSEISIRVVTAEIVAEVVAEMTDIPIKQLTEGEKDRFISMADIIKKKVIGQNEAVEKVARVVKKNMAGLKDPKRPVGVFLFLGPTGVGKTELAKALAEFMLGSENEIIRFDMSEFKESHSISKLIGAPPGYIGHEAEGQLTGRLRTKPHSIVLLDEIEKAHPEVFDLFLQVFDEGRLTDSKGRTIDAKNALFIMTSNLGTEIHLKEPVGFGHPDNKDDKESKKSIKDMLSQAFRPEFLNRIDAIIVFNPLALEDIHIIALKMLSEVSKRLEHKGIQVRVEDAAIKLVSKEGYDPFYGARPLKRAISKLIEEPLSDKLLMDEFQKEDLIIVDVEDGEIAFRKGRQLLERKDDWMDMMETADAESIYETLRKETDIGEVIKDDKRDVAIMFTDLKDCVLRFEEWGTVPALDWIERHNDILTPIIGSYGGTVLKHICDAIMAVFEDPKKAVMAAIEIQKAVNSHNEKADEAEQYHIRISLNVGKVTLKKGDVFGRAVNIAARIDKNLALPGQILMGESLYEFIENDSDIKFKMFAEKKFKGVKEKIKIYEVLWRETG